MYKRQPLLQVVPRGFSQLLRVTGIIEDIIDNLEGLPQLEAELAHRAAAGRSGPGNPAAGFTAVSYTHLDVYKRQLLQQASASLSRKRFHAQGGSFYALYNFNPRYYKKLVSLIVALQTISDYLDNLCDRGGIYNEAAFRCLHRAMTAALTRGPIKGLDYYRFYPVKNDGGYLEALVAECRSCTGILLSLIHI